MYIYIYICIYIEAHVSLNPNRIAGWAGEAVLVLLEAELGVHRHRHHDQALRGKTS